jgi:hypothetical protein
MLATSGPSERLPIFIYGPLMLPLVFALLMLPNDLHHLHPLFTGHLNFMGAYLKLNFNNYKCQYLDNIKLGASISCL